MLEDSCSMLLQIPLQKLHDYHQMIREKGLSLEDVIPQATSPVGSSSSDTEDAEEVSDCPPVAVTTSNTATASSTATTSNNATTSTTAAASSSSAEEQRAFQSVSDSSSDSR